MAKVRMVFGIIGAIASGIATKKLYDFTNAIYAGENVLKTNDYTVQLYFFGWIGYAVAAALAILTVYFIYYFLQGVYDTYKGR